MKRRKREAFCVCLVLSCCAWLQAQEKHLANSTTTPGTKTAYYIDAAALNVGLLLPGPPAVGSAVNNAELAELHRIEDARTPEQVAKAKADDGEEDIFIFKTVLGAGFTPEALPLTAALGEHVKNEQSVAGEQLKRYYQRPRPYQTDAGLHPVCALKTVHDSYPSGHSLTGYLEAFTLVELVPERRAAILSRADQYARNREVCGVHYPSDVEASRQAAYMVFGYMLSTPRFQRDLAGAREEMQTKLKLEQE